MKTVSTLATATRLRIRPDDAERGDVPGWVLVTLMTAGLVLAIYGIASPALQGVFNRALESVAGVL